MINILLSHAIVKIWSLICKIIQYKKKLIFAWSFIETFKYHWKYIPCTWIYESLFRMLKLKLQYFCHLMQRADSLVKTLMLGKIEGRKIRGQQRMREMDGITKSKAISLSKFWEKWRTGKPGVLQSMGLQNQTWLSDWTTKVLKEEIKLKWRHTHMGHNPTWLLSFYRKRLSHSPTDRKTM